MDDHSNRRTTPPENESHTAAYDYGTHAILRWFHGGDDVLKSNATDKFLSRIY
jgi:hypothetical protein